MVHVCYHVVLIHCYYQYTLVTGLYFSCYEPLISWYHFFFFLISFSYFLCISVAVIELLAKDSTKDMVVHFQIVKCKIAAKCIKIICIICLEFQEIIINHIVSLHEFRHHSIVWPSYDIQYIFFSLSLSLL